MAERNPVKGEDRHMKLEWYDDLTIGVAEIDVQHKELIDWLVNHIARMDKKIGESLRSRTG
jgi:hemerythrin